MPSILNEAWEWLDRAEQAREVAGQLTACPEREFLSPRARGAVLAGGSGTLRTGEIAPHLRFVKTGPESSRIELANAGQLTVNRGLVFTMSLESKTQPTRLGANRRHSPSLVQIDPSTLGAHC